MCAAPKRSTDPLPLPMRLAEYLLTQKLGAGGMGQVCLATVETAVPIETGSSLWPGDVIAVKILRQTQQTPTTLVRRFLAEAELTGRLRHPHIVGVYVCGEALGVPVVESPDASATADLEKYLYLAMEYVDGRDLEHWVRKRGPLPADFTVRIMRQLTEALQYAHQSGLVHRDIKPSNVLMRKDGTALLADLGLARAIDESADGGITRAGFTVGTVDFMPPEQARSSRLADARSDLYSLGCLWFFILTGRVPYAEGDLTNKLRAHAQDPVPDPRDLVSSVPAGIVAVLQRLLAKKPADRYGSAEELLGELKKPSLCRETVSADALEALALPALSEEFSLTDEPLADDLAGAETDFSGLDVEASNDLLSEPPPGTPRDLMAAKSDATLPGGKNGNARAAVAQQPASRTSKSERSPKKRRTPKTPVRQPAKTNGQPTAVVTPARPPVQTPSPRTGRPVSTADQVRLGVVLLIGAILIGLALLLLNSLDRWLLG